MASSRTSSRRTLTPHSGVFEAMVAEASLEPARTKKTPKKKKKKQTSSPTAKKQKDKTDGHHQEKPIEQEKTTTSKEKTQKSTNEKKPKAKAQKTPSKSSTKPLDRPQPPSLITQRLRSKRCVEEIASASEELPIECTPSSSSKRQRTLKLPKPSPLTDTSSQRKERGKKQSKTVVFSEDADQVFSFPNLDRKARIPLPDSNQIFCKCAPPKKDASGSAACTCSIDSDPPCICAQQGVKCHPHFRFLSFYRCNCTAQSCKNPEGIYFCDVQRLTEIRSSKIKEFG